MKTFLALICAASLSACDVRVAENQWSYDQCVRPVLFQQCLAALPAGPQATKYNDLSKVVEACADAARLQSSRRREQVKPECRG